MYNICFNVPMMKKCVRIFRDAIYTITIMNTLLPLDIWYCYYKYTHFVNVDAVFRLCPRSSTRIFLFTVFSCLVLMLLTMFMSFGEFGCLHLFEQTIIYFFNGVLNMKLRS